MENAEAAGKGGGRQSAEAMKEDYSMATIPNVSLKLPPDLVKEIKRDRARPRLGSTFNLSNLIVQLLRNHYDKQRKVA
jgi:hypothetical protein